jgi:hypothetical protein
LRRPAKEKGDQGFSLQTLSALGMADHSHEALNSNDSLEKFVAWGAVAKVIITREGSEKGESTLSATAIRCERYLNVICMAKDTSIEIPLIHRYKISFAEA